MPFIIPIMNTHQFIWLKDTMESEPTATNSFIFIMMSMYEMYDLEKDPAEMNNIYNEPAYEEIRK